MKKTSLLMAATLFAGLMSTSVMAGTSTGAELLKNARANAPVIATADLEKWIKDTPEGILIDLRTQEEITLTGGTIMSYQNTNVPRGWLELRIEELAPNKDTPIVVYCGTDQRSPLAAQSLTNMGYTNVKNYAEGFSAWKGAENPINVPDRALDSMLYSLPQEVAPGIWSAIGEPNPPSYLNSGHNNNLSFIVTSEGVVVVNASASYLLAKSLHAEIKKITDQPVKYVILENGQGHAAMGSSYWKAQGAEIIAHVDAAEELKNNAEIIHQQTYSRFKDKALGSEVVQPDITFEDEYIIELGGERIEALHLGPAHSPGDISVWLPAKKTVIAGDIAFHQRLLAIFEETETAAWVETWDLLADLKAEHVVPGHGAPTTMDVVTEFTLGYLVYLRGEVGKLIEDGGDLKASYAVDQSNYQHLNTYKELAKKNAGQVFVQMEFE